MIGAALLLAGAAAGWLGRGRYDRANHQVAAAPIEPEEAAPAETPRPPTHDDELRSILGDPKGRALAAKVRNASRVRGSCEIEVDTSVGWFRVGCGTGQTPSVGEKFESSDGTPPKVRSRGSQCCCARPGWSRSAPSPACAPAADRGGP